MPGRAWFRRTSLRAAQHPLNALVFASGLAGAVILDNPLPLAIYALSYAATTLALWNWRVYGDVFEAEDVEAERLEAARMRCVLEEYLEQILQELRSHGYRNLRAVMQDYAQLSRLRDESARLAKERQEVSLTSEAEIVRRLDQLLAAYLTLAHKHLVYLSLLTGIRLRPRSELDTSRAKSPAARLFSVLYDRERRISLPPLRPVVVNTKAMHDRPVPPLRERLAVLDRQRDLLEETITQLPAGSPHREAQTNLLKALEQRRHVFEEAGRNHASVLAQLDSIKAVFAVIADRMAAADLVADDVSGYLETAATEIEQTLSLAETERLEVDAAVGAA